MQIKSIIINLFKTSRKYLETGNSPSAQSALGAPAGHYFSLQSGVLQALNLQLCNSESVLPTETILHTLVPSPVHSHGKHLDAPHEEVTNWICPNQLSRKVSHSNFLCLSLCIFFFFFFLGIGMRISQQITNWFYSYSEDHDAIIKWLSIYLPNLFHFCMFSPALT